VSSRINRHVTSFLGSCSAFFSYLGYCLLIFPFRVFGDKISSFFDNNEEEEYPQNKKRNVVTVLVFMPIFISVTMCCVLHPTWKKEQGQLDISN